MTTKEIPQEVKIQILNGARLGIQKSEDNLKQLRPMFISFSRNQLSGYVGYVGKSQDSSLTFFLEHLGNEEVKPCTETGRPYIGSPRKLSQIQEKFPKLTWEILPAKEVIQMLMDEAQEAINTHRMVTQELSK